jgi:predicted regulator of Ras-like GTPase activity (Roadblock/LC7/MglB family)
MRRCTRSSLRPTEISVSIEFIEFARQLFRKQVTPPVEGTPLAAQNLPVADESSAPPPAQKPLGGSEDVSAPLDLPNKGAVVSSKPSSPQTKPATRPGMIPASAGLLALKRMDSVSKDKEPPPESSLSELTRPISELTTPGSQAPAADPTDPINPGHELGGQEALRDNWGQTGPSGGPVSDLPPAALNMTIEQLRDPAAAPRFEDTIAGLSLALRANTAEKPAWQNELINRAMTLEGVAGAIVALPDGLVLASRLPPDQDPRAIAEFLPQIFAQVSRCTRVLKLGELINLSFNVGGIPWMVSRAGNGFFAAFGRADTPLSTAQLAKLAEELAPPHSAGDFP